MLTCYERVQVKIINISTGFVEKSIPSRVLDDVDPIVSFTVNQKDDDHLVVAHSSGLLKQWNWKLDPPQLMRTWKSFHNGPVSFLTFDSFNGSLLASGGSDAIIKVWDTNKQYCTHHLKGAVGVITSVAFQPLPSQSVFLLAGVGDKKYNVVIWNLITSKVVGELVGHISVVTNILFKNQTTLITSSRDKIITIWDLDKMVAVKNIPLFESIESLILFDKPQFIPDASDSVFICAGESGSIRGFNTKSGTELMKKTDSGIHSNDDGLPLIKQMKHLESRNELMIVSHENNIIFRSLTDASLPVTRQLVGHMDEVLSIKFIGTGHRFIAVASNSPNIKVYDLSTCNCLIVSGHDDTVLTIDVFGCDPSFFISSSKDNSIRVWHFIEDKFSVRCLFQGSGHTRSVTSVVAPSKSLKWAVSGSEDTILKMWRIKDTEDIEDVTQVTQLNSICSVKAHNKDINSLAVAPNDQIICSGSQDKVAKLWAVEKDQLKQIGSLVGHRRGIWCVNFSPVDQVVVTSSSDMTCKIWALNDHSCLKTFQGHDCGVLTVRFITRGMQLLSTGSDGNVKIWSVKANECQKTIDAHSDKVWTMCPSKDESHFVSGSADSHIVLWEDVTSAEIEEQSIKVAKVVEAEQGLRNLIEKKKWRKALKVAIILDQPFRCLTILREINMDGDEAVMKTLRELRNDQIISLLKYSMKWNTNSKFCSSAQQVLQAALVKIGPTELLSHPEIKEVVASFLAYTERHFQRTQRLVQQMSFVEFIFENMRLEQTDNDHVEDEVVETVSIKTDPVKPKPSVGQVEDLEGSSFAIDQNDDALNDSSEAEEEVPTILGLNDPITLKENRIKAKKSLKAKMKAKTSVKMRKTTNRMT